MRKLIVSEFMTLDGVMQAPGGKDEDRDGGFEHGGWTIPYWHDDIGESFGALMKDTDAFLLGRRTYMTHAEAFEPMPPGDPFGDLMNAPRSFLWGGGVGHTVGIPLGAHYAGGRRGALVPSMPVSAAIFGAGVLALRSAVKNGNTFTSTRP